MIDVTILKLRYMYEETEIPDIYYIQGGKMASSQVDKVPSFGIGFRY